jgi:hypothetical protein
MVGSSTDPPSTRVVAWPDSGSDRRQERRELPFGSLTTTRGGRARAAIGVETADGADATDAAEPPTTCVGTSQTVPF